MRTADQALRYMYELKKSGATGFKGWCLRTCRQAWGLAPDAPSAIVEWNSIPAERKSRKWWKAPAGAPHFWAVGEFGHVALQSRKKGYVYSTDAPVMDKVGVVSLNWFKRRWGATYLGWSWELNNTRLPIKGDK